MVNTEMKTTKNVNIGLRVRAAIIVQSNVGHIQT